MILEDTSAHTFSLANVYSTCSSNSVDVDDDYCRWWWWWCWWYCVQPKESEYVARLEMTWLQWLQLVSSCMTLHVRWDLSSDCISRFWEAKICEQKDSLHYEPTCGSSCLSNRTGQNCGFPFHHAGAYAILGKTSWKKNVFFWALPELTLTPLSTGAELDNLPMPTGPSWTLSCMVGIWHWHIPTFIITDISPPWWDFVMVGICRPAMMMAKRRIMFAEKVWSLPVFSTLKSL